jgi:outer membrane receptor protein involved in Fe transport
MRLTALLRHPSLPAFLLALACAIPPTHGQIAPAPAAPAPGAGEIKATEAKRLADDLVRLNPFEVKSAADNSYGALNSNSLTQFDAALKNVPVSADIFTEDFIRDVGVTNLEDLMLSYGAGAGTVMSNPESDALSQQPGDRVGNQTMGVRGVGVGAPRRDGFAGTFGTGTGMNSLFDIERADVVRGPQGLLYGASGAGGTVNIVSKRANFNRTYGRANFRIDQHGSKQALFDYNWGAENVAVRVALLNDHQLYRRVFIGHETEGIYTQVAARVAPLRTVVRLIAGQTENTRVLNSNQENIAFTNAATDPRHNYGLAYLLRNNMAGANDPVTGRPYPRGAIANGLLTWDNINSWAGTAASEYVTNKYFIATAETVWTPWLATQFSALYNNAPTDRANGGLANLSAPLLNGNPLDVWANGGTLADTEQPTRRWATRGSAIVTNDLFRGFARSKTLVGFDIDWADTGPTDYSYFLADANFNVIYNPAIPSNLGRTPMPRLWWSVADGPVKNPLGRGGWLRPRVTTGGQNYIRMANNPRDPSWVRPNNPLGLASLAGNPGVSGQNNDGHHWESRVAGVYAANNTDWWKDRIHTLVGLRINESFKRTPNLSTLASAPPWAESTKTNKSYNLGINGAILPWLNAYYSFSSTYNTALVNANDPLGNPPATSSGVGHEFGLKFGDERDRISGSIQYYATDSKDEMINAGTGVRDLINPTGLNGSFDGPAGFKNQWVNLDRTTRGIEVILTANPTSNWKVRLAATTSDGQNLSDKKYPLLWNDDFYVRNGGVTYQNGNPVLVPTTPNVITPTITTLNRQVDPATLQAQVGGVWEPLTLAMMNDRANPYWANPADDNGRLQTSNLRRVLQYFVGANGSALTGKTGRSTSDIPYAWSDPNGTKGETTVAKKGENTVGYAQYVFSMTNSYSFTGDNFLKGISVGGTIGVGLKNRTFYYNIPGGGRELFSSPDTWQANTFVSYRRKIGKRYGFSTQVNVTNVFNHYVFGTLPNNGSGYTNPANLGVSFYGQPRLYVWTNTVSF